MAIISYFSREDRITRSKLLIFLIYLCPLCFLNGNEDWKASRVNVGVSVMKEDADVIDLQNSKALVFNCNIWQSKVLLNTLILTAPATFSYLVDPAETTNTMYCIATTLSAEAFFLPIKAEKLFFPFMTTSFGPAYFSKTSFGKFLQGGAIGFQSTLGLGVYYKQLFSLRAYILHYCSAGLYRPNNGMTIPLMAGGFKF